MKIITNYAVTLMAGLLGICGTAQNMQLSGQQGYKISCESGAVSQLSRWKNFGGNKHHELLIEPVKKMNAQMGIKPVSSQNTTLSNNYEFFGGEAYKGNNVPYDAINDAAGNTYVTGGSTNENQPAGNFFTMKVSPTGEILWQQREAAPMYAVEYGMHLAFDNAGNIFAAGLKWNGNDMDIRLIKYSPTGEKIWESTFQDLAEGVEIPADMVIDADNNIYLTGIAWHEQSVNYLTVKFNSNGTTAWHRLENPGGSQTWNEATAIARDSNNNILITGYSPNPEGWLNYHTVKYDNAGNKLWEQAYSYTGTNPDNTNGATNSVPRDITADAGGNIYITGTFDTFTGNIGTIKYNATGVQQWAETYKSGTEITTGWQIAVNNNAVYVAGNRAGEFSDDGTVLLSYDVQGNQNWAEETTDLVDSIKSEMLLDNSNNIVISAKGMTPGAEEWQLNAGARAYKYSPEGELLGQAAFVIDTSTGTASMGDIAGTGLDSTGNLYFTVNSFYSETGAAFETVKSGFAVTPPQLQWNAAYTNTGATNATMLNSLTDNNNNTISTGSYFTFSDNMLNPSYFVVKHNAQGIIDWNIDYNAENGNAAEGIIVRTDAQGNIYVCLLPGFDVFPPALKIKKLSPEGTQLWETSLEMYNPQLYVMEPHSDGSLYLGGTSFESENSNSAKFTAIKLNSDGTQAWKTLIPGTAPQNTIFQINDGKVTPNGEFILAGAHGSGNFMNQDVNIITMQFSAAGTQDWVTTVPAEGVSSYGTGLFRAADGSLYINGYTKATNGDENIVTTKLNPSGVTEWVQTFGDSQRNERSYTIKAFSNGDIAVTGYSLDMFSEDINNTVIKYSPAGEKLWDFASANLRYYNDFHIDGSDVCYILNQVITDPFPHKIFNNPFPVAALLKLDSNGQNSGEELFAGPEYAEFYGKRFVPQQDNRLLLAGSVGNQAFFEGTYFFETQHDGSLGLPNVTIPQTGGTMLGQNYPNPAQDVTTIPFYLQSGGKASIKLYTMQGRLVQEVVTGNYTMGNNTADIDVSSLAPGIYFYQIQQGSFRQARKMVVK